MSSGNKRFSRQYRLTRASEYRRVFQNARKFPSKSFTVLVRKNDLGHARLGLVVSKKSIHKAILRNRLKRVVRESFRHNRDKLDDFDIVLISRMGIAKRMGKQLQTALGELWTKIEQVQCKKF